MKRSPMKRGKSDRLKEFDEDLAMVTPALIARAHGVCEVRVPGACLGPTSTKMSRHHRLPRGNPACTNRLGNLLYVCGDGTTGCHGYIEHNRTEGYNKGWLIRSGVDEGRLDVPWTAYNASGHPVTRQP